MSDTFCCETIPMQAWCGCSGTIDPWPIVLAIGLVAFAHAEMEQRGLVKIFFVCGFWAIFCYCLFFPFSLS